MQADSLTGGTFVGPNNGSDALNINGPVNATGTATAISAVAGQCRLRRRAEGYPQLIVYGTVVGGNPGIAVDNAPNGIATGAVLNMIAGFADLEGNDQTLAGLIGPAGSVANSPSNFATLTLHETSDSSYAGTIGGNLNLVKNGPAEQALSGNSNYTGSTVVQNGSLRFVGSGAWNQVTNGNSTTFTDIQGGKGVFDYSTDSDPASTVSSLLAASYTPTNSFNNTAGTIRSSTGTGTLGLGMFDDGVSKVTVAFTVFGDANLDGKVNALDFNALATNFGMSGTFWYQGDFNYDNTVDTNDFMILAQDFNKLAPIPTAGPVLGALVPEPASLGLIMASDRNWRINAMSSGGVLQGIRLSLFAMACLHRGGPPSFFACA